MMKTILAKVADVLYVRAKKLPDVLMVTLLFTLLFQQQAKRIFELIDRFSQSVLPKAFIDLINDLNITSEEICIMWEFLIIFTGMFAFGHIAQQVFGSDFRGNLDLGGTFLLHLNSIILICIVIYNRVSEIPIYIEADIGQATSFNVYSMFFYMSLLLFILFFGIVYLQIFWQAFNKIVNSSKAIQTKVFLCIIVTAILTQFISSMISNIVFK